MLRHRFPPSKILEAQSGRGYHERPGAFFFGRRADAVFFAVVNRLPTRSTSVPFARPIPRSRQRMTLRLGWRCPFSKNETNTGSMLARSASACCVRPAFNRARRSSSPKCLAAALAKDVAGMLPADMNRWCRYINYSKRGCVAVSTPNRT